MEIPQKIEIEFLYNPAIPLLGIYPEEKTWSKKIHALQCSLHYSQ